MEEFHNEADTRAKLIDPALYQRGWSEDKIKREETPGAVDVVDGKPRKRAQGRIDYTLRVRVNSDTQPVALALIEAKSEQYSPGHGLQQGKEYAAATKRLNVQFVFSTNGHGVVEYDHVTGETTDPYPISEFPTPDDLRQRYENAQGFSLNDYEARPLLVPYPGGEATRRYYQDAAIRATLEKLARCEKRGETKRALLSLATGAGKTFIAVHLLKRIADAGQLRKALFVCDRDELRTQALGAFQNVFGANAAAVSSQNPQKNARILIATYQTLDVDTESSEANFLTANYPENYFSHIIIDECHRSAWGKWSMVLTRNPEAVQIGLTATPRQIKTSEKTPETQADGWPGYAARSRDKQTDVPNLRLHKCHAIIWRRLSHPNQEQKHRRWRQGQHSSTTHRARRRSGSPCHRCRKIHLSRSRWQIHAHYRRRIQTTPGRTDRRRNAQSGRLPNLLDPSPGPQRLHEAFARSGAIHSGGTIFR